MLFMRNGRKGGRHLVAATIVLLAARPGDGVAAPIELTAAQLDAVTAGADDGASANAEATGAGPGNTAETSVLASVWQGLGTTGWTGRAIALASGADAAHVAGGIDAQAMPFLTAEAGGTAQGDGSQVESGLATDGLVSFGSDLTLGMASLVLTAAGKGPLSAEGEAVTQTPDAQGGPGRTLSVRLAGETDDGSLSLSGRVLILRGPLRGLVFQQYAARGCCGDQASLRVETTFAPFGTPAFSASQIGRRIDGGARIQSGATFALTSFGQSFADIGPWR
jgi:hypothetical protein